MRCWRGVRPWAAACLLVVAPMVFVNPARAQGAADTVSAQECCLPLLFAVSARSLGLGDAVTARSAPGAVFANPALVADIERDQFAIHSANTTIEKSTTLSLLIRSEVAGTFGIAYRLIDYGESEATDENGNPTGRLALFEQVLTATYATRVGNGLNAGVNYKLYQFRNDCRGYCGGEGTSATTHGLDLGLQYRPSRIPDVQVGAAIVNLGFPLQVVNEAQASPMPVRLRFGAAYEIAHHFRADRQLEAWAHGDIVANPRDPGDLIVNLGGELAVEQTIFLWAGYAGGSGLSGGAGVGVGLRYDRFDAGVAKRFISSPIDESEPTQVSFGIRF